MYIYYQHNYIVSIYWWCLRRNPIPNKSARMLRREEKVCQYVKKLLGYYYPYIIT
ncbi:hypothetical protein HBA_0202 [Sodalis endosymbiont of Henestaris halophilus]|nr:hypothetical protein HBA_0202 [Sodalis endosymbiont of Henestaris halophilus]